MARTHSLVQRLGGAVSSRQRELALLVVVMGCAFGLMSLAGWDAADPTVLRPGPGVVSNPLGPAGALVAELLYSTLGYGAWGLFVPMVLAVVAMAGRRVLYVVHWLAGLALYVALLAGLDLVVAPGVHSAGGALGAGLTGLLTPAVGALGTGFVLVAVAVLSVTVLLHIDWGRVARWALARLEVALPWLGAHLASGVRWTARRLWALVAATAQGGLTGARSAGSVGLRGAGSVVGGVRRMVGSLFVREDDDWDEDELEDLDDEERESLFTSEVPLPARETEIREPEDEDDRTQVGRPAALVEVEWDPTTASKPSHVLGLFPDIARRTTRSEDPPTQPSEPDALSIELPPPPPGEVHVAAPAVQTPAPAVSVAVPPTPTPASARPSPVQSVPIQQPALDDVVVHRSRYLDLQVDDDGGALADEERRAVYHHPPLGLLDVVPDQDLGFDEDELRRLATTVEEKLATFKIGGKVTSVRPGPVVTIFEFLPDPGIKVSRIANLTDDLAMALRAVSVRIVAPIPGKGVVGIEIPSARRLTIYLREVLASEEFRGSDNKLPCVLGKDVEGRPMVADLAKMPHLLVGGTTGSGKSVGVNGMLMSMLYTRTPDELRLLLIDPKMLEFELYEGIPHLLHPVVTEPKKASAALAWATREMDDRYKLLARWGTRNIISYNDKVERELADWTPEKARRYAPRDLPAGDAPPTPEKLPYIVIVIDELADLMMVASKEVEESIARIAQKARACGIHLIVATQRPSVDVITGLIKANLPTRIAFQLRTKTDSRTVLDQGGAETLLGKGDMLYLPPGVGNLTRTHGAFVSDGEVERVCTHLRQQGAPDYLEAITADDESDVVVEEAERDDLYYSALEVILAAGKASTSMIQRHLKIGYNRAARIIDVLEADGIVGPADGARPREILMRPSMP